MPLSPSRFFHAMYATPALKKHSPRFARWLPVLAIIYAVSPIDFIPDIIPLVGWLDDIGILLAVFKYMQKNGKWQALS